MKIQLPTLIKAPPVSACPLVQPRANLAANPIMVPPVKARSNLPPDETRGPLTISLLIRPENHPEIKPPTTTPRISKTSQSISGCLPPFPRYSLNNPLDAACSEAMASTPTETNDVKAPEAPRPRPIMTKAESNVSPNPIPAI